MLSLEYTLSQYDSSPRLTACTNLVILIDSSCVEQVDISKNFGKSYKNTNFDKEDILANHKSFMSSLNIPINEENCELSTLYWIPKFQKNQYLDRYILLLVQHKNYL
jgi:hypothetical protein